MKITTQLDWPAEKRDIDSMELASCSSLICRYRCIHIDVVKLTKKRKRKEKEKEKKLVVEGEIGQWERRRIDVNITINTAGGSPKGSSIIGYRIEVINKNKLTRILQDHDRSSTHLFHHWLLGKVRTWRLCSEGSSFMHILPNHCYIIFSLFYYANIFVSLGVIISGIYCL